MDIEKQITDLLWANSTKVHAAGSCGELGDSFMAIDSDCFSELADKILQNFEPKKCMPEGISSKEEHERYLKDIGYEKYVKDLEHHKDTTVGLYSKTKPSDKDLISKVKKNSKEINSDDYNFDLGYSLGFLDGNEYKTK